MKGSNDEALERLNGLEQRLWVVESSPQALSIAGCGPRTSMSINMCVHKHEQIDLNPGSPWVLKQQSCLKGPQLLPSREKTSLAET